MGMHSGSASALHAESPGFDSPHLQASFEWSRVRFTLGASIGTYSSEVERSIADIMISFAEFYSCNICYLISKCMPTTTRLIILGGGYSVSG